MHTLPSPALPKKRAARPPPHPTPPAPVSPAAGCCVSCFCMQTPPSPAYSAHKQEPASPLPPSPHLCLQQHLACGVKHLTSAARLRQLLSQGGSRGLAVWRVHISQLQGVACDGVTQQEGSAVLLQHVRWSCRAAQTTACSQPTTARAVCTWWHAPGAQHMNAANHPRQHTTQ